MNNMNDALLDEMKVIIREIFFVSQPACVLLNTDAFLFQSACVRVEKSERRVEKLQAEIAELRAAVRERRGKQTESASKTFGGFHVSEELDAVMG